MSLQRLTMMAAVLFGLAGLPSRAALGQSTLARAYLQSADAARADGKAAKAARLYALALTEARAGQDDSVTAKALLGAATIHIDRSEFDQAEKNVRAALALCEKLPKPPAHELATGLNCMAKISVHRQQFEQAEACYVKLLDDLKPDEETEVLRGLVTNDLAIVKIALAQPQEGIELARSAAGIIEAKEELATMHREHASRAAVGRPSLDELKMFEEMYAGLGLAPDDLAALMEHWANLNGPQRMEHYLDFQAEVAARCATSSSSGRSSDNKPASSSDREQSKAKAEDGETLFQELFGRHKLAPDVLKQRRAEWDQLTPQQRRTAAALVRQSIRSQVTAQ